MNMSLNVILKQRYGIRTCMMTEVEEDMFETKLLDQHENMDTSLLIRRARLYEAIPRLLDNKYTVVIIEIISKSPCLKDITAVHLPVQSYLNTPPLFN